MVLLQCWLAILKQIKDVDLNLQEANISLENIGFAIFYPRWCKLMLSTENWSIIIIIPKFTLWPSEPTLLHYEWLIVLISDDRGFRKSFIKYHSQKEELHETRNCTIFFEFKGQTWYCAIDYFTTISWPSRRYNILFTFLYHPQYTYS